MTEASRSHRTVLTIGEALIDRIVRPGRPPEEAPGGSPANVALGLGRLGRRSQLATTLGPDERGALIADHLRDSHVEVLDLGRGGPTATATADLAADGSAEYTFALDWDPDPASLDTAGTAPAWVHTGSIAAVLQPGADRVAALLEAHRADAIISFDPNIRPDLIPDLDAARERIDRLVRLADVIKASDEDLAHLHPGRDLEAVGREWLAAGASLVVITEGPAGARLMVPGEGTVRVAAADVEVVDTVGAGDTFMATLIDGLLDTLDPSTRGSVLSAGALADLGARCAHRAGITVARHGADLPWL